jgi:hypothetical protein
MRRAFLAMLLVLRDGEKKKQTNKIEKKMRPVGGGGVGGMGILCEGIEISK